MWVRVFKCGDRFAQVLIFLAATFYSLAVFSDAHIEFQSLSCNSCHGKYQDFTLSPGYTHESLEAKIHNDMPANDPSMCIDDCAHDMANLLLSPDGVVANLGLVTGLPLVTSNVPAEVDFRPSFSKCLTNPCKLELDFGDGTSWSQTTSEVSDLPEITHSYISLGDYHVTLTVTDTVTGDEDYVETYIFLTEEESFAEYVASCKSTLGFDDSDIPNDLNCANAYLFDKDERAINDYVGHRRINEEIDLLFACRWVQSNTQPGPERLEPPFVMAESVELLMHNRVNGETCFFKAKEHPYPLQGGGTHSAVPVDLVPPTVSAAAAPGSYEAEFWDTPMELARFIPCVDCHAAGPYIATPRIAPFLARFGVLNDGHDTFGRTQAGTSTQGHYHIAGTTFAFMNSMAAYQNNQNTCANGCHSIQDNSPKNQDFFKDIPTSRDSSPAVLIPAINSVLKSHSIGFFPEFNINDAGVMPVNDPASGESPEASDYTWINQDTPYPASDFGDVETIFSAREKFEKTLSWCGKPHIVEAHVVGSDLTFHPYEMLDQLSRFNTLEGLVCLNGEQADGSCHNYEVRYQCKDSENKTGWTRWFNVDSETFSGDHETRSAHENDAGGNVCGAGVALFDVFNVPLPSEKILNGNRQVSGIEGQATAANGWTYGGYGPDDRLAEFDSSGLVCKNADQPDGQCSNYVVKYLACSDSAEAIEAALEAPWSGNLLTARDTFNSAETRSQPRDYSWNTQDWVIEREANTTFVRLKNTASGLYLTVENNNENAVVRISDYSAGLNRQRWEIEPTNDSTEIRFRNVGANRYLTVVDDGDFSEVLSKSLRADWISQRWKVR